MSGFLKTTSIAFQFVIGTAVIMMVYQLIRDGSLDQELIFNACFFVGIIIIGVSFVVMILPSRALFEKTIDHSNIVDRTKEYRERKMERAYSVLIMGIMIILITGIIQVIVWLPTR